MMMMMMILIIRPIILVLKSEAHVKIQTRSPDSYVDWGTVLRNERVGIRNDAGGRQG